jgi:hypothetical protein
MVWVGCWLYASPPPQPSIFPIIIFLSATMLKEDDQHLLAGAMASDFSVGSFLKENNWVFITDQTPRPFFD